MTMPKYVEGIGRNEGEDKQHSHMYEDREDGYYPLCVYGFNRDDGRGFSIFRGHRGARGLCKLCEKRVQQSLPGLEWPTEPTHKTKYL